MNQEMAEAPEQSLEYVKFARIERPQKTFFYKRKDTDGDVIEDSEVFACYEQEAGLFGQFHKLIGVSDGQTYYNYLRNCGVKKGEIIPLSKAQEILRAAFEAELAMAIGKKERPNYQAVHFDETILRHKNAKQIMDGFTPN